MNEHYCCDNIIPHTDNGIIMCANCKTILCNAPKSTISNGLLSSPQTKPKHTSPTNIVVINELTQNLSSTTDLPTITQKIDENDIAKIINEFKRQKYTKERIAFCSRTMIKIVISNVGLTNKYGHLVEDVRKRLVTEKW